MVQEKLFEYFNRGSPQGQSSPSNLYQSLSQTYGRFHGLHLSSVFQPLLDAYDLTPAAHEALLRVNDIAGNPVSPADAFAIPSSDNEAVHFDRLCRIVHVLNFVSQARAGADLFLNVSGRHLLGVINGEHGELFESLLNLCGLKPQQIILEVLEARVEDIARLNEAVAAYRRRGYRVAIDDFGCENSNFDRLWRLTPDIVKIDRSLILQGINNERARRILPKIIEIIHELGAQVVCEGIETAEQHAMAVESGSDFVQGFL